jgi:small neutral amino acid transporter SnatA (MarC family)
VRRGLEALEEPARTLLATEVLLLYSDLTEVATVMEVLLAVLLIVHVSLLLAPRVVNVFRRKTGASVLSRILGVLLAAL